MAEEAPAGDADLVDDAPENVALVKQGLAILTDNAVPVASPAALVRTKNISDQPGA